MKQINRISHLLVALFFGVSLVFFLAFDSLKGIFRVEELNTYLVTNFLWIGLFLFLISWGTDKIVRNNLESEISKKETEKNELKAKLYDFEQGVKLRNIEQKLDKLTEEKEAKGIRPRQNFT
ncbi:hypothetical protein C943_02629 [Mariniradius saccharolyticus AK6]|uniref:Uncharacterized protein n=1 Tax=Mariniradius saccharolyticus AK6 TaxID=1239962 RepID=M7Y1G6_9BACT|nr:hypothetical protein [Mariniradius saccharolyticus]EMS31056.1 hypothetical protein C943_02629 [Mariniradius saccharolyticus AK6]